MTAARAPLSSDSGNRLSRLCGHLQSSRLAQFLLLLTFAVLIRCPMYGEWNYDLDDEYYYLIGQRLLHGATLYVDIWDRKGPALYLLYAAISAISSSAIAYQIAATLCAALAGYGVNRTARLISGPGPALMAGLAYCALLNQFGGENGQAPVFYNPLVIAGAWSVATRLDLLRRGRIDRALSMGMACAGIAIAFKQSVAIEAAFFGQTITVMLWQSARPRPQVLAITAALALIGAMPMLATFAYYAATGHFASMWQALVSSNLDRGYYTPSRRLWYLAVLAGRMALPLVFAAMGFIALRREKRVSAEVRFLALWALVAIGAVTAFPAVFVHYALTMLAPLCVLCAPFFARRRTGAASCGALIVTALALGGSFNLHARINAHRETPKFEAYVRKHTPDRRLLVWGVPSALYARMNSYPPSPILFAPHYYERSESYAIGHNPTVELQRILDWKPETVIIEDPIAMLDPNLQTITMVKAYLRKCRAVRRFDLVDHLGAEVQWVHTGCAVNGGGGGGAAAP